MAKTDKISNLKRLNSKNKILIVAYLIKTLFKAKPSPAEEEAYVYYNFLINNNGFLVSEDDQFFISDFFGSFRKRIKLRKRPSSDLFVFQQVYGWKGYEPVVEAYNKNFSSDKTNIIDAGSNTGLTSLYFLEHFKNAKIVCIEPQRGNFEVLEFNLAENNNSDPVKINGGIWSSNTKIKVVSDFRDQSDWAFRVIETTEDDALQAYSINSLAKQNHFEFIDILKIDVEGSEKEIFDKTKSDLGFLKITKCIAVEIHDEFNCREDIYSILTEYGFAFFQHGELTIGVNQNLKHNGKNE